MNTNTTCGRWIAWTPSTHYVPTFDPNGPGTSVIGQRTACGRTVPPPSGRGGCIGIYDAGFTPHPHFICRQCAAAMRR